MFFKKLNKKQKGTIITMVLVFTTVFLILLTSLLSFVAFQLRFAGQEVAWYQSLTIAEAGLNYYRWHLAHDPDDLQDGQGSCCALPPCSACGPYEHDYVDPEGGIIGKFSLTIAGEQSCGVTSGIKITSVGWTEQYPDIKRDIEVKYVRPTVADFAYLLNDNVWAGADRIIRGPYHSNGGIRMDGGNNSLVSSAQSDWVCTNSFGCSSCPADCWWDSGNCTCPGVFTTANGDSGLFSYPVSPFDFDGITMDLAIIKTITSGGQGLYFPPTGQEGYHFEYLANGSIDVYQVTGLNGVSAYDSTQGWHTEYSDINSESFLGNYNIPGDCSLIFVEDNLWAEGTISGKVTTISADLIDANVETDVWLIGDIVYTTKDGSDGFVLLGQNNNLIGLYVPDSMELDGAFIAQNGHFGRNHYPSGYDPYHKRSYLEIFGSIVSNGRVGTKWSSGGSWSSGFNNRENIYDPDQSFSPAPFLPAISEEYEFKDWEEIE